MRKKTEHTPRYAVLVEDRWQLVKANGSSKNGNGRPPRDAVELPQYVVIDEGRWAVIRNFPSKEKYKNGRAKYIQIKRRCEEETELCAKDLSDAIEAEVKAAKTKALAPLTVGTLLKRFESAIAGTLEARTLEIYSEMFTRFIYDKAIEQRPLAEMGTYEWQEFFDELKKAGTAKSAMKTLRSNLVTAYERAILWGKVEKNAVKSVVVPKVRRAPVTVMDEHQTKSFQEACAKAVDRVVFEFALETYARPQEYLALRRSDINLKFRRISISRAIATNVKGIGFVFKDTKTDGSKRSFEISTNLRDRIVEHYAFVDAQIAELQEIANGDPLLAHKQSKGDNYQKRLRRKRLAKETIARYREHDLVFPASNGGPISRLNLNRREFADTISEAKLGGQGFHLYTLRHTGITLNLLAGGDIKSISEKAGHSEIEITLNTYAHVLPSMSTDSLHKLAKVLYA